MVGYSGDRQYFAIESQIFSDAIILKNLNFVYQVDCVSLRYW